MTRVVSWNLGGRLAAEQQLEAVFRASPDIVAFQEVTARTATTLADGLRKQGFSLRHTAASILPSTPRNRGLGVLLASRLPISEAFHSFRMPWPEKGLSFCIDIDGTPVDVHCVYVPPGSSNGWIKIEHFEAIYASLTAPNPRPRILVGDFNSPQFELADGRTVVWGQKLRPDGAIHTVNKRVHGTRWADGERLVFVGFANHGIADVFRSIHGPRVPAASFWMRKKGQVWPRRFDHAFCTSEFQPVSARYDQQVVESRLSDHAMLVVEVVL